MVIVQVRPDLGQGTATGLGPGQPGPGQPGPVGPFKPRPGQNHSDLVRSDSTQIGQGQAIQIGGLRPGLVRTKHLAEPGQNGLRAR